MSLGPAGRIRAPAAAPALAVLLAACEVVTLEPDPDVAADARVGVAGDLAFDVRLDMIPSPPVDAGPVDLALPPTAVLMPMALDFGEVEPYTPDRRSVSLRAGRDPLRIVGVAVVGDRFELAPDSPRPPVELRPGATVRWTVEYTPEVAGRAAQGALVITAADAERRVPLSGRGSWSGVACAPWTVEIDPGPPAFVEPSSALQLKAKPPSTITPGEARLAWFTVDAPTGQGIQPAEAFDRPDDPAGGGPPDDPETFTAVFFADKAGRYAFEAHPRLPGGAECAPPPSVIAVHACPCPERPLHVRIGWRRAADAAPGTARVVALLADADTRRWRDALGPDRPPPDWGGPGEEDDPRVDVLAGDASGRIDLWLPGGALGPLYRLGLGAFNHPDGPPTRIDVDIALYTGRTLIGRFELAGLEAGRTFWDGLALISDGGSPRVVLYDRLMTADPGRWPDLDAPLGPDSPCDPFAGPRCHAGLRCRGGPGEARCAP